MVTKVLCHKPDINKFKCKFISHTESSLRGNYKSHVSTLCLGFQLYEAPSIIPHFYLYAIAYLFKVCPDSFYV